MRKQLLAICLGALSTANINAQSLTDTTMLPTFTIVGYKTMNGIGHVNDYAGQVIFAGKKNEILTIDSLAANKALNNTRQVIGRIPGVNIIETEASGFTANGIAFRGLNPYQSIEMNTRQDGYNISADVFGYNESYYLPPMEAVHSIELLRGSAGLQFGSQIGGMINYKLKEAPNKPFQMTVAQTAGSFGMYNAYTSVGGTLGKWKYFGFMQYRYMDGWRENSDQKQLSGFGKISYDASPKLKVSLEYTMLRNKIHMPGGLTDSLFNQDPKQSLRARNWLESPWNILASNIEYKISKNTSIDLKTSYLFSQRNLIWRNEDIPADVPDTIENGSYSSRELEREYFNSITNELRVLTNYHLGDKKQTLAFGIRQAYAVLKRREGADGSTGTDFSLAEYSPYEDSLHFRTNNLALFAENIFHVTKKFSITPGVRLEYLSSSVSGRSKNEDPNAEQPFVNTKDQTHERTFVLGGVGLQYNFNRKINAYANYSQSYRPVTYSDLTPFGTVARIDPNLKDSRADNADIGIRGTYKGVLNFDVSAFYINYKDKVGVVELNDTTLYRTNTGTSQHTGIESYVELNISDFLFHNSRHGKLSIYNSFAYIDAHYTDGEYKGNQVEYAPHVVERAGVNYWYKGFSVNAQYTYQSKSYGDAANVTYSPDALAGIIPSYNVIDLSASYKWSKYKASFGINNLTDKKYFTLRTSEYPGPGIIPAIGRMVYGGLSMTF